MNGTGGDERERLDRGTLMRWSEESKGVRWKDSSEGNKISQVSSETGGVWDSGWGDERKGLESRAK